MLLILKSEGLIRCAFDSEIGGVVAARQLSGRAQQIPKQISNMKIPK